MLNKFTEKDLRRRLNSEPSSRIADNTATMLRMAWENFGSEWCLYFITPKRNFDLTKPDELRRCFSLENLKPAWNKDVMAKGGQYRTNRFKNSENDGD